MKERFIGVKEYSSEEKDSILSDYDEYQLQKLDYLNDMYSNISTLLNYWSYYNNHIHNIEVELKKDLIYFNLDEIESIIANKFTLEYSSRSILEVFIKQYFQWGMSKGYANNNPMDNFDKDLVNKTSYKVLKNKIIDIDNFYIIYDRMCKISGMGNAIPYLLARYGVVGNNCEWMAYLRWDDIDYENKVIRVFGNGKELITTLEIDDRFIEHIKEWEHYIEVQEINENKNETYYIDCGYVIRRSSSSFRRTMEDDCIEPTATIYNRLYNACNDIEIKRMSLLNMVRSAQLDELLNIRSKRKLTTKDFSYVCIKYKGNDSYNLQYPLIKFYEDLSGEKVVRVGRMDKNSIESNTKVIDNNSLDVVKAICERIDYKVKLD